jgi:hypothetical protein
MEGYEFLTAHFTNNNRTIVEVYWTREDEDGKPDTVVEYVEASIDSEGRPKDASPQWTALLKHTDIDTLHDNTAKHMAEEERGFDEMVIEVARKKGLIHDIDVLNSSSYKAIADLIFAPFDPEENKESLFMFKLQLFELDDIKKSKNRPAKAQLRKSKSIVEALRYATEIVLESE